MCSRTTRHSIFCFLPPHVLRSIAERGTLEQRINASRTLDLDATFRALRAAPLMLERTPTISPAAVPGQKRRTIYTAHNEQLLPGEVVATEQNPPTAGSDLMVREAFEGLGATFDFFWEVFDRESIDDEGMALDATVHYGDKYSNAFWNGQQMVFGDGDGEIFNRFTSSLDIIAHELAHGVTEDEAGLAYMFQPGALNESMSDVMGSLVKQRVKRHSAQQADWLIGEGLFTSAVNGTALRSMKAPGTAYDDDLLGKDPQPDHMAKYVNTYSDNGGVHINSGIPNKAFYLTATKMGGYAWEKAGRIWYETLRDSALRRNTGFRRFAKLTVVTAGRLYGPRSTEEAIVADAWASVGIAVTGTAVLYR